MPDVPRGAPLVDLLVPVGTSPALPDVQTRLELSGGAGWRLHADDGTMEQSIIPTIPLRGSLERVWAARSIPLQPGEPLQEAVGVGMEVALTTQAHLAAVGVYGVIGWGVVLFDEPKWLYGLTLLEWLYNPRLGADGELIQEEPDAATAEANLQAKARLFPKLFTPEATSRFVSRVPPGAIQEVESLQALTLLGPGGGFDPRYWQSFAVQMALAEVQHHVQGQATKAAGGAPGAPPAGPAPGMGAGPTAGMGGPSMAPPPPPKPAEPDDGLTPLQRARRDAERKATEAAANPEPEPEPVVEEAPDGGPVRWVDGERPLLVLPADRLDAGLVRSLQGGSLEGLTRGEHPSGSLFERWVEAGGHFVTEVPFLSRLFLENAPLHKGLFAERATDAPEGAWLDCHLPRVGRVRAVMVLRPEGRRIILSSDQSASAGDIVKAFG